MVFGFFGMGGCRFIVLVVACAKCDPPILAATYLNVQDSITNSSIESLFRPHVILVCVCVCVFHFGPYTAHPFPPTHTMPHKYTLDPYTAWHPLPVLDMQCDAFLVYYMAVFMQ